MMFSLAIAAVAVTVQIAAAVRLLHFDAAQHCSLLTLKRQASIRPVGPQD